MCDYSLELVASRPAKVGDKLISTGFPRTSTRGFASVDDSNVAVCLLPGTELGFEDEVRCETGFVFYRSLGHRVARFRHINKGQSNLHRDALELPIRPLTEFQVGRRAIWLPHDFEACRGLHRAGQLTLWAWLRSWLGARQLMFCWDDPVPAVVALRDARRERSRR